MTEEINPESNTPISIEQICAAIINKIGTIEIELADLVTDYSKKSIAVNQDTETKAVTFTLIDTPEPQEVSETETAAEDETAE
jgi:hypothetical protein